MGGRRDAGQVKLAKEVVVLCLSLAHLEGDSRLVVTVGGEVLGLLGGDGDVPLDQGGPHSSAVSIPRDRGATSSRSDTASEVSPVRMAACTVAAFESRGCWLSHQQERYHQGRPCPSWRL